MKTIRARALTLLAVAAGSVTVAVSGPPAAAVTETSQVLVTSQYGGTGCANNQKLLIANPFTGALVTSLGTPDSRFDVFNEAKPYDSNRKIVALWGGSDYTTHLGGVGVYDRTLGQWTTHFPLPSSFEVGGNNPHSITALPDGWFAVALVGTISGVTGSGHVVLLGPTGAMGNHYGLSSAHGVEYDSRTNSVYAVGATTLKKFSYDAATHSLTSPVSYTLPASGGHDLRRRRNDGKLSVTADNGSWTFDPATGVFDPLRKTDGSLLGNGVKNVDQRFDGLTEYNYYDQVVDTDYFQFLDGTSHGSTFCTNFYKAGRWLYAPGDPDFDDGGGTPAPTWSPTFTVGGGSNSWWIEVYTSSDVASLDVIGKNGQFFMANLPKQSWGAFAQSPPEEMTAGSLIKLIARKADGATAGSVTFSWLQDPNPGTEAGWTASFTVDQCGPTKLEATISSAATQAKARIGTADWAAMTKNASTGHWEITPGVPAGTKYLIRAYLPTDEKAYDLIRTC
jgi:hypothetical protein